jgi:transposase
MSTNVPRLLATASLRTLDPLEKAVSLVENHGVSKSSAAKHCGVSRRALDRAFTAKQAGRKPGVRGRPKILTEEEEKQLVTWVEEAADRQTPVRVKTFQDKVPIFGCHGLS